TRRSSDLEFCRRQAKTESLAASVRCARAHRGIRCDEPRSVAARIQIRRFDNLLRLDASHWHGKRPPRHLPASHGSRRYISEQITKRCISHERAPTSLLPASPPPCNRHRASRPIIVTDFNG